MPGTVYELGVNNTSVTGNVCLAEFAAGANRPASILEFGWFMAVSAAAHIRHLGRPGNTPTTGTLVTATAPASLSPTAGASVGGLIITGWATAPTIPAAGNIVRSLRQFPAVNEYKNPLWSWREGELVVEPVRSNSLILWAVEAAPALGTWVYVKWVE